ncbi:hypothetical protein ACEXQD_01225 [Herbiconiux sp. P15]|uniref:hypothetical protein n=1 Tax=Herbiconiux liukaitaii TaxID=3342799 RepID=UPI0035B8C0D5
MSDIYAPGPPSGTEHSAGDDQGKVDSAKQGAADLKNTAAEQAGNVAGTAKDEAAGVAHEAKTQAKDLYHQTQHELKEQAGVQQERAAAGLRTLGDELGGMADGSENQGVASDLVRQVSNRASSAASWLDARDPGSLLDEVKSYARRKPGTFIAAAAIAGLVAGRLTRALAQGAAEEKAAEASAPRTPETAHAQTTPAAHAAPVATTVPPVTSDVPPVTSNVAPVADATPLYTERASTLGDGYPAEGDRR